MGKLRVSFNKNGKISSCSTISTDMDYTGLVQNRTNFEGGAQWRTILH